MKISFVTLVLILLTVNILIAGNSSGQNIHKTAVLITPKQGTLKQVFAQIEEQSIFRFAFLETQISSYKNISAGSGRRVVSDILKDVFAGTKLEYSVKGNTIIVLENPQKQSEKYIVSTPVSGIVKNASGEPLEGVSVTIKDTKTGTTTTENGLFTIDVEKADVLVFSRVGYESKEVIINDQSSIEVTLNALEGSMDEILIVGYGTQKRENATGAVSQIQMDKVLGDRPVTNLGAALQGAAAGLTASSSVVPGEGSSFNIRGFESINSKAAPLILVDGVVMTDINLLNPNDIEKVTVLKDASSAAIYGARASFGVVLITTKKGKKNEAISLNYSGNFSVSKVNNRPKVATPLQVIQGYKDMGAEALAGGQNIDLLIHLLSDYQANPSRYPLGWVDSLGTKYFLKETDVMGDMLEPGFKQMHNLSVQGGGQNINYRLAIGQSKDNGVLVTKKDLYKRTNVSSFVDGKINKWLSTSLDVKYASGSRLYPITNRSPWNLNRDPLIPTDSLPYEGTLYAAVTPKNEILSGEAETWKTSDTRLLSRTVISPAKNLNIHFEYTFQHNDLNNRKYDKLYTLTNGGQLEHSDPNTTYYVNKRITDYTSINVYANYEAQIGKQHNIAAVAGFNQEESKLETQWSRAFNMISGELPFLGGASGQTPSETGDSYDEFALRGVFGRVNYNYKQKYLIELNGRYDMSSRFPSTSRAGFFPSISAGWVVNKEEFAKSFNHIIQMFKIRGSFGELGNQSIDNYGYLPTLEPIIANWIAAGAVPKTLKAPPMVRSNFTWENVRSLNGGIDLGILKNRLTMSFDIYKRLTLGMLAPGLDFPAVVGAAAPLQNAADLKTNGWELTMNWNDRVGEFNYGIGFNLYNSKTFITKYKNETKLLASDKFYEGQQIGEIWGYVTDGFYTADDFTETGALKDGVVSINGIISKEGDIKYKNLRDGDNSVNVIDAGANTALDPGDRMIIGNTTPRFNYGINGFADWKGIGFSFILQGVLRRDAWIAEELVFPHADKFSTFFAHQLNYWTPSNKDAYYGRLYPDAGQSQPSNQRVQTRFLQNAAYMRVKNITLSYRVPTRLTSKINLRNVKVFYSGENLFTFTKLIPGVDPESLAWEYPHYITNSFGINIGL